MIEPLSLQRLEVVEAWGQASRSACYVYRPSTLEQLKRIFELARATNTPVGFRGAGRSYGDAALNAEGILIDLRRMNRILEWDPEGGVITVEPGVTIAQLWRYVLGDGWWPPVVPGTMHPTVGGCAAMNIHGKNNWQAGPIGEQILAFEALLPDGRTLACTPEDDPELFHTFIGGLGLLGCFTNLTLKLKRIYSGRIEVLATTAPDLQGMLAALDERKDDHDYGVGWIDCTVGGSTLGRGQLHFARYLPPDADPDPFQSLQLENQDLPDTFFGIVPRSIIWRFMAPFMNNPGVRLINVGRYYSGVLGREHRFEQTLAEFNFLLDYIPGWKRAYLPGGLIQYQSFLPKEAAEAGFTQILECCLKRGLPSYLGVLKRHRPDAFLLSHSVDGFSLALDFKVTRRNRDRLTALCRELDEIVLEAGGRFYFAKDSTLHPDSVRRFLGAEALSRFKTLKERCDPDNLLQSNLSRRVFPGLAGRDRSDVSRQLLQDVRA